MKSLIILSLLAVVGKSCDDKSPLPSESHDTIYIDVNQGEVIEHDTSIGNYMGTVEIIDSTKHHILSELYCKSTDVYHRYQSLGSYVGNDTLKLKKETIDDTSESDEIISIRNITIVLTIK